MRPRPRSRTCQVLRSRLVLVGKLQVTNFPAEPRVPIGAVRIPTAADVPQGQNVLDGIKVEPLEDPVPDVPRAPDTQPDLAAEANAGDSVASGTNGLKIRED